MIAWSYKFAIAFAYWSVFTGSEGVTALQQIFHIPDTGLDAYPTINAAQHLPNIKINDCKDFFRQSMSLNGVCPNGTIPHCVENNYPPMKELQFICKPNNTCDEHSRSIVYVDPRIPSMYFLGKTHCMDGFSHSKEGDCFAPCNVWDGRIPFFKQIIEHLIRKVGRFDYTQRYCTSSKLKPFELTRAPNVFRMNRSKVCRAEIDILPDCTRDVKCTEGYSRDAADKIKLKKDAMRDEESSRESQTPSQISNLTALALSNGLRISWCITLADNLLVKHVKVSYRAVNNVTANYLPAIYPEDDCQEVVIEHLFPGQKYTLSVEVVYEHNGQNVSVKRSTNGTTKPNSVEDLNATFFGNVLSVEWLPPNHSINDKYIIGIRSPRKEFSEFERNETSYLEPINGVLPGEKYEVEVYSVSNNVKSNKKNTFLIYPPLPPEDIHCALLPGGDQRTDRQVFWFNHGINSFVEGYYVSYGSTSKGDSKIEKYLPITHGKNEISHNLIDLHPGQTYIYVVKSRVGGVNSTSKEKLISIPPDDDDYYKDILIFVLSSAVVGMLVNIYGNGNEMEQNIQVPPGDNDNYKDKWIFVLSSAVVGMLVKNYGNGNEMKQNIQGKIDMITKKNSEFSGNVINIKSKDAKIVCMNHSKPEDNSSSSSEDEM